MPDGMPNNTHLKNCPKNPENRPSAINKVSCNVNFHRLLCLLLPIQDGQLQPAVCLNYVIEYFETEFLK